MTNSAGSAWNPLEWLRATQDWFARTERSSGFRPYLIFVLMLFGFCTVLLSFFPNHAVTTGFCLVALLATVGWFLILFGIKAFQDPNFCRSEKHIENVRRMQLVEQKGDPGPRIVDTTLVEVVESPDANRLTEHIKNVMHQEPK